MNTKIATAITKTREVVTKEYITTDGRKFDSARKAKFHQEYLDAKDIVDGLSSINGFYLVTNQEEYNALYVLTFGTKPYTNVSYRTRSSYPFFVNVDYSYYSDNKKGVAETVELFSSDIAEMSKLLAELPNSVVVKG